MQRHPHFILAAALLAFPVLGAPPASRVATEEEVQKPAPFSGQEQQVIRSVQSLNTERLTELLRVYEKLGNEAMLQILVQELLNRNPDHSEANRISAALLPEIEVRPAGYLDKLAAKLLAGQKVEDAEGIATLSRSYIQDMRAGEAVRLLEKLREVNFNKQDFPYLDDLAVAYHDNGQLDASEKAWKEVLANPATLAVSRQDAEKNLALIALERRIMELRAKAVATPHDGPSLSASLLAEMPSEPLAIAFHIECLKLAGQHAEAVAYLKELKSKNARHTFEYQDDLGDAYLLLKDYDSARQMYRELLDDPEAEEGDKGEAQKMLSSIDVTEKVEEGLKALQDKDVTRAAAILAELEVEHPGNEEVFGYRCLVMAKTGHSEEALRLLQERRSIAAGKKELFMHLDTLGDVHLERKEFELAAAAYEEILQVRGYDEQNRKEAVQGLVAVERDRSFHLAHAALLKGRKAEAKKHAEELQKRFPFDPEVLVLQADVKLAYGKVQEAIDDYNALKDRYYRGRYFPGQADLATAYRRGGKPAEALAAVNKITEAAGYEPEESWNSVWERRELLPYLRHQLSLDLGFTDASEGREHRQALTYASPWLNEWRLVAKAQESYVSLKSSESIFKDVDSSSFESQVSLQRRLRGNLFVEATIGGSQNDLLYGARVGSDAPTLSWSLGFSGNARSTESMSLEAFDGREDRVDFALSGLVGSRVRYGFEAYVKRVKIDGDSLGDGYGASGSVEYVIQAETRKKPEISIGYFAQYAKFTSEGNPPSSVTRQVDGRKAEVRAALPADSELRKALPSNYGREIFDTLVDPETHRHGMELTLRKHLNLQWNVYVQAGTYYELDQRSFEYTAAAGIEYWLSDNAMLYAEVRYDSSGRASSEDQAIVEASLGAEITF